MESAEHPSARDWSWVGNLLETGEDIPARARLETSSRLGLVLLNTPLSETRLRYFWAQADTRICADGAANRLLRHDLTPDTLIGDFDSIAPETLDAFRSRGVPIRDLSYDQDTTDLEKSLAVVRETGCDRTLVAGQFAGVEGRLDHTFGIANALHQNADMQIVVMGDDCHMFLLTPGEHQLYIPTTNTVVHCGLVPLGSPCSDISTTGLKWNMTNGRMEFGGLISVCNQLDPSANGHVWVNTNSPVLWMCSLPRVRE